jgi:hypothetical protein
MKGIRWVGLLVPLQFLKSVELFLEYFIITFLLDFSFSILPTPSHSHSASWISQVTPIFFHHSYSEAFHSYHWWTNYNPYLKASSTWSQFILTTIPVSENSDLYHLSRHLCFFYLLPCFFWTSIHRNCWDSSICLTLCELLQQFKDASGPVLLGRTIIPCWAGLFLI